MNVPVTINSNKYDVTLHDDGTPAAVMAHRERMYALVLA